jgi:stage V sporulation protein B
MKEQSTTKGFAILSAAGMAVKVLSLLYVPLLLKIIGDEGYGIYGAAYQIYVFVYVLTNSGIPVAISKLISELTAVGNYKDALKAFKMARFLLLILGLVMSILMIVFARSIVKITDNEKSYLAIIALAPTIFITSVMSAYRGYFQGRGNMTPTAVSQIGEQIINTVFSLIFAVALIKYGLEAGAAGGTIGTTLGALAAAVYLIIIYEKNKRIRRTRVIEEEVVRLSNNEIIKKLIYYAIPVTLGVGLQNAGNIIDMANIKGRLLEAGFIESVRNIKYGVLIQYNTLLYVPITFITALSAASLPAISGAAAINNRKLVQEKINYSLRLCFIVSVPAAVGLAVLSRPIYRLLFTAEGYTLMLYGSIVVVLMAVVQIQTTILQSIGKLYVVTLALLLGIVAKVTVNYFTVSNPSINISGAVLGSIVGFLIPLIVNNKIISKSLKVRVRLVKHALKPVIASTFMGLTVYVVYFNFETLLKAYSSSTLLLVLPMAISVVLGILVYVYALILTGGITSKDLASVSPRLVRAIPAFMKERIR